jgi:hypothetical protein
MALGYLFAWLVARGRGQRLVVWAALTAGILPDYDILFSSLGLWHHTYTHSFVLWAPVMVALVYWRRGFLPYVAAVLQHIVVGDFLVGRVPILFPLSKVSIGLNLGMPSWADAILESGSLLLALLVMWRSGDLKRLLKGGRESLLMAVPLLSMVAMALLWRGTPELEGKVASWVPVDIMMIGGLILVLVLGTLLVLLRRTSRSMRLET